MLHVNYLWYYYCEVQNSNCQSYIEDATCATTNEPTINVAVVNITPICRPTLGHPGSLAEKNKIRVLTKRILWMKRDFFTWDRVIGCRDCQTYLIKLVNNWLYKFIDLDLQDIKQKIGWSSV